MGWALALLPLFWLLIPVEGGVILTKHNTVTEKITAFDISSAYGVTGEFDNPNAFYVSKGHRIVKIENGVETFIAGDRCSGPVDGPLSVAHFCNPRELRAYAPGKLYVADYSWHCIRHVDIPNDEVTTVVGKMTNSGYMDGIGTIARFYYPKSVAVDVANDVMIAPSLNKLHKVTISTREMVTLAGDPNESHEKRGYVDGQASVVQFNYINAVEIVQNGSTAYVMEYYNNVLRRIDVGTGYTETVSGTFRGSKDGLANEAMYYHPQSMVADRTVSPAMLYVVHNNRVRAINTSDHSVETIAGTYFGMSDGLGTIARFISPRGIGIFVNGTTTKLYFTSDKNCVYRTEVALPQQLADTTTNAPSVSLSPLPSIPKPLLYDSTEVQRYGLLSYVMAITYDGGQPDGPVLYAASYDNHYVVKVKDMQTDTGNVTHLTGSPTNGYFDGPFSVARFYYPVSLATIAPAVVLLVDRYGHRVRKIDDNIGIVTTLGTILRGHMDGLGTIARYEYPRGICWEAASGLAYIGGRYNVRVMNLATTEHNTLAGNVDLGGDKSRGKRDGAATWALFGDIYDVEKDPSANHVYIIDYAYYQIRKLDLDNQEVTTYVGRTTSGYKDGWRRQAMMQHPSNLWIGMLHGRKIMLVAELGRDNIRAIDMMANQTYLFAGKNGGLANGAGTVARFNNPYQIAHDTNNTHTTFYVADYYNHMIRVVREITTQAPTATLSPTVNPTATINPTATMSPTRSPTTTTLAEPYASVTTLASGMNNIRMMALDSVDEPLPGEDTSVVYVTGANIQKIFKFKRDSGGTWQKTEVTGSGNRGFRDGPASSTYLYSPTGITYYKDQSSRKRLFFCEYYNHAIRTVNLDTEYGETNTLIGTRDEYGASDGYFKDVVNAPRYALTWYPWAITNVPQNNSIVYGGMRQIVLADLTTGQTQSLTGKYPDYRDGIGSHAMVHRVSDIELGPDSILYFCESVNKMIRKLDLKNGEITTIAGTRMSTESVDGPLSAAQFMATNGLTLDLYEESIIYVTDGGAGLIRAVDIASLQTFTIAGKTRGLMDGVGTNAQLSGIYDIEIDPRASHKTIYLCQNMYHGHLRMLSPIETYSPSASPTVVTAVPTITTAAPTAAPTGVPTSTAPTATVPTTASPTTTTPTLVPLLPTVAQMRDSGTSIHVTFSRSTNSPDLPCILFFRMETNRLLGDSPKCVWAKDNVLTIILGQGYEINPYDSMTFYGDVIFDLVTGQGVASTTLALQAPLNPVAAVAVARGPSRLGVCGSEFLSASESRGNAGRSLSFKWLYVGHFDLNGTRYSNSNQSQTLSTLAESVTTPSLELEASRYGAGVHRYMVFVSNWFNKTDNATVEFTKLLDMAPRIQLSSPRISIAKPGSPVILRPQAFPALCSNTTKQLRMRVHWFQIFGDSAYLDSQTRPYAQNLSQTAIVIPNPDILTLTIPVKNLLLGDTLGFVLRAKTLDIVGNVVGEIYNPFVIKVNSVPVTAVITGGSSRDISVLQIDALLFNALESNDPASLNSTSLTFQWTLLHPNGSTTHPLSSSYGILSLQPSSLTPGATYGVTVTVTGVQSRVATASQIIMTKESVIPNVELSFRVGKDKRKVNAEEKLSLAASARNISKWEWTCLTNNFDLETADWSGGVLSGIESPNLVFAPGSLKAGLEYQFRVTATGIDGGKGSSALKFEVNQPPLLGSCSVSPAVGGISLKTNYRFECVGWSDDPADFPLEYKFQAAPDKSNFVDLCQYRELSYYTTILSYSEASAKLDGNLTLRALVRDFLGAKTAVKMQAEVLESSLSLESVEIQLQSASSIGDFQTASVLIEGIITQSVKTTNATSRRSAFSAALGVLDASRNSSLDSNIDPESFISQVKSLTSAEAKPESEGGGGGLTTKSALLALSMVEGLSTIQSDQAELSEKTVKNGLEVLSNVMSSSEGGDSQVAMSGNGRQNVSDRVEGSLRAIAQRQTANAVIGEPPYVVNTDNIQIISELIAADDIAGSFFETDYDTATVVMSSSLSFNETDDQTPVQVIVTSIDSNMYQTTAKSTTVTTVEFIRNNTVHEVKNASQPFVLFFGATELSPSETYECRFWDVQNKRWSSEGMKTVGFNTEYVACESTHLTAFSAQVIEGERVDVEINSFGKNDIKAEAFSLNNPVMLLCTSIVAAFVLLVVMFSFVDRHFAKGGKEDIHDFWRETNYMKKLRADVLSDSQKRNFNDFGESMYWGLRRKHIWTSICIRHPADFLTSIKRLVVLITLIFNTMTVCLLLLDTEQSIPFLNSDFSIAIVAMFLAYPIPLTVYYFFQRPVPIEWYLQIQNENSFYALGWILWILGIVCSGSMDEMETDFGGDDDDGDGDDDANDDDADDAKEKGEDSDGEDEDDEKRQQRTNKVVMATGAAFGGWLGTDIKLKAPVIAKKKERKRNRTKRVARKLHTASKFDELGAVVRQIESAPRERKIFGRMYKSCRDFGVSNHDLSYNDIIGFVFACVVVLGCWFIIAVLSFKMRDRLSDWVVSNCLSFAQDIFIRFVVIVIFDLIAFMPCWCCCYTAKPRRIQRLKADIYAVECKSGDLGFTYRDLKVVGVEQGTQADYLGIKRGMRLAAIGPTFVNTDAQAAKEFYIVHRTQKKLILAFEIESARENGGYPPMYKYKGHLYSQSYPFSVERDKNLASLDGGVLFFNRPDLHPDVVAIMKSNPYDPSYDNSDFSEDSSDFFDTIAETSDYGVEPGITASISSDIDTEPGIMSSVSSEEGIGPEIVSNA